jgi:hypothetical protein
MSPLRKTALVAGVLYLLTFVSIPTLFLYGPVKSANYIVGPGPDTAVIIGGILEMIVALAGIGTAVALYPVVKRQNEGVALVVLYNRTFLLGQGFIPAVNALLLGSLLYQSRLVPRVLPILGFIGAAVLVASDIGVLFSLWGQFSAVAALATLPIAIWEFSLGVYLVVKGFKPSPILSSSYVDVGDAFLGTRGNVTVSPTD